MRSVMFVVMGLLLAATGMAQEAAPAPTPWYGNVQLWEILATAIAAVWAVIKAKYHLNDKWDAELMSFLEHGVRVTYDTFVRGAKAKSPDGKLTQAQITEARDMAFNAAKELAKQKGIDLAKKVAAEKIPLLINTAVANLKGK